MCPPVFSSAPIDEESRFMHFILWGFEILHFVQNEKLGFVGVINGTDNARSLHIKYNMGVGACIAHPFVGAGFHARP